MDETIEHSNEPAPEQRKRSRLPVSSKAIPYGSDELSSFAVEDYDASWEINHTVIQPPL